MAYFTLCAVPAHLWEPDPRRTGPPDDDDLLRQFLVEAKGLWRRIHKRVNTDVERSRYVVCLAEMEPRVLRRAQPVGACEEAISTALAGGIPALRLDGRYFDFIVAHGWACAQAGVHLDGTSDDGEELPAPGVGACVFPPGSLLGYLQEVDAALRGLDAVPDEVAQAVRLRSHFIRDVCLAAECGLVEAYEVLDDQPPLPAVPGQTVKQRAMPPADLPVETGRGTRGSDERREAVARRLRLQIEAALRDDTPVNFSNQTHDVSTDVLAEFVPRRSGENPGSVRVLYADGSEGRRFPLLCLAGEEPTNGNSTVLRAALMSMRHIELDPFVDFAWFRNNEVSRTRSLAETDEFCFGYSLEQLRELAEAFSGRYVALRMYHTGFEPAVVGFYRAVVAVLSRSSEHRCLWAPVEPWLRVEPYYFRGFDTYLPSEHVWS